MSIKAELIKRFKSLLIAADGDKYSPEGYEDNLCEISKYIDQCIIHNNQNPYTMALVVPNKDALKRDLPKGLDPESKEGKEAMLRMIQADMDSYRPGGKHQGMFPEKWLPAAVAVLPEAFTEQNGLVNSTSKVVRGKVEKRWADRIEYAYTTEGKALLNPKNMESV